MPKHLNLLASLIILLAAIFCTGQVAAITPPQTSTTGNLPLTDMGSSTYLGFSGGLYPGGSNTIPSDHLNVGLNRGRSIQPLDINGNPSTTGKYVLLSIGMSNTTQEFCSQSGGLPCDSWTFTGKASIDSAVDKTHLVIANGALGGQTVFVWDSPTASNYNRVRDTVLIPQGLSEKQVQAIWLKDVTANPTVSLPSSSADAYTIEMELGKIVRAAKVRYPNLRQVFLSSRIFGGYAITSLNPEPYAYESGFAVKWLIEAQIRQMRTGTVDPRAGDLNYNSVAPWISWGAYLWADGTTPRSDGLVWRQTDFETQDYTHPSQSGEQKVGRLLLDFFKTSSVTKCWFIVGGTCP